MPDSVSDQIQGPFGTLVSATGNAAPHMPESQNAPQKHAAAEVVFPVAFISGKTKH